ncbi:hypothetical protein DPMN_052635 [Dreissena polymorpha]|uniref:Uncharacterized protein n=1 Tax=Dreissena polymorpha TaxID=45954 RepID=A0A9D4CL89_DREPO|nr:hypothetical protein DPMN_052635 [Dreissena polymorpha]
MITRAYILRTTLSCAYNQDDPEDKRFVQDLIEELEGRRGLRLYVPGRDDLSDASQHISNAGEIEGKVGTYQRL